MAARAIPNSVWFLALVLAPALAGCASEDAPISSTRPSSPVDTVTGGPRPVLIESPAERNVTLYLDTSLALVAAKPEAGAVPLPPPSAGPVAMLDFLSTPTGNHSVLPGPSVKVVLHMQSDGPLVSNGGFDVGVWAGTTRGMPFSEFMTYPTAAVPPGTPLVLEATMDLGEMVPPVLPAGEQLRLIVGSLGDAAGSTRILVGGETPSRIEVVLRDLSTDPLATDRLANATRLTGQATGTNPIDCTVVPALSVRHHEVTVDANATYMDIQLRPVTATGVDIDFNLRDGERLVATSHSPSGEEGALLALEPFHALRGKTLDLRVTACTGQQVDYEVVVTQA